jgi:glutamyl-Q tRNA(Asp) synthetase
MAAREAFGFARERGGECLLRIEDIDHTRCKPAFTEAIYEDLRWLGFDWPDEVRVQSEHLGTYAKVAERLREMGVIYPCALSRKEVAARSVEGVFRGEASAGENPAWRLSIPATWALTGDSSYIDNGERRAVDFDALSDEIVVRRDIGTSYYLACTHDDEVQGITHVVRGEDLREVTPVQVILQKLLGWKTPEFVHHGLVMDGDRKLSKREGDASARELRARGVRRTRWA